MIMNSGSKSWYKQDERTYRKGQFTISQEQGVWVCRFGGKVFDKAKTLKEAKKMCE